MSRRGSLKPFWMFSIEWDVCSKEGRKHLTTLSLASSYDTTFLDERSHLLPQGRSQGPTTPTAFRSNNCRWVTHQELVHTVGGILVNLLHPMLHIVEALFVGHLGRYKLAGIELSDEAKKQPAFDVNRITNIWCVFSLIIWAKYVVTYLKIRIHVVVWGMWKKSFFFETTKRKLMNSFGSTSLCALGPPLRLFLPICPGSGSRIYDSTTRNAEHVHMYSRQTKGKQKHVYDDNCHARRDNQCNPELSPGRIIDNDDAMGATVVAWMPPSLTSSIFVLRSDVFNKTVGSALKFIQIGSEQKPNKKKKVS